MELCELVRWDASLFRHGAYVPAPLWLSSSEVYNTQHRCYLPQSGLLNHRDFFPL